MGGSNSKTGFLRCKTIESFGNTKGTRNTFTRNYSVELDSTQYELLCKSEKQKLVLKKIKFEKQNPTLRNFMYEKQLWVPYKEVLERQKEEDDHRKKIIETNVQKAIEKRYYSESNNDVIEILLKNGFKQERRRDDQGEYYVYVK
jgi:hypothetical protein